MLQFGLGHVEWGEYNGTSAVASVLIACIGALVLYERRSPREEEEEEEPRGKEESAPLLEKKKTNFIEAVVYPFALCCWMVFCSCAIIYVNAYILDNLGPCPATLTALQQGAGFLLAFICVYGFQLTDPVDMTLKRYVTCILPLAVGFSIYLGASNAAYVYLSPGLIQMIKPFSSALVFLVAVLVGLETYSHAKFLNFLLICSGVAVTAAAKLQNHDTKSHHIVIGLGLLILAYTVVAFYNTGLQILQRHQAKFNPLTTLLYLAPAACVFISVDAVVDETPLTYLRAVAWWLLVADCLVAFVFNLSMMLFIGTLSAVAYSVFAFAKEIILVAVSVLFFQEAINRSQLEGYLVTLLAVVLWQYRKLGSCSSLPASSSSTSTSSTST